MLYKNSRTRTGKLKLHCWSDRNSQRPWEVPLQSANTFWFVCDECETEFNVPLTHVVQTGRWCPNCYPDVPPPKCDYTKFYGPSFAAFT
jgi:hypothetical protein